MLDRVSEIYWILSNWDDVDADFLRFYNIDLDEGEVEVDVVGSARFFKLANRLAAYEGMVAARLRMERESNETPGSGSGRDVKEVPLSALSHTAVGSGIIEFQ